MSLVQVINDSSDELFDMFDDAGEMSDAALYLQQSRLITPLDGATALYPLRNYSMGANTASDETDACGYIPLFLLVTCPASSTPASPHDRLAGEFRLYLVDPPSDENGNTATWTMGPTILPDDVTWRFKRAGDGTGELTALNNGESLPQVDSFIWDEQGAATWNCWGSNTLIRRSNSVAPELGDITMTTIKSLV